MVVKSVLWLILIALLAETTKTAPLINNPKDKTKPNNGNKYKMYIQLHRNVTLEEDLVIDTKRETEIFLIPKHKLEVIKDFSKKLDVIFDSKKKTCYVSRQQMSEERPATLKSLMKNKSIYEDKDRVFKETSTWKVDAVFTQRFLLSKEMAVMCAGSSMYWIQKTDGTGSNRQSRDEDFFIDPRSVCVSYLCWYITEYRIDRSLPRARPRLTIRVKLRCRRIIC